MGLGAAVYGPLVTIATVASGAYDKFLIVDRDGDGSDEIVVDEDLLPGTRVLEWSFVSSGALFAETQLASFPLLSNIVLADFNGDGIDDLTFSAFQRSSISLGQPGGTFAAPLPFNGATALIESPFAFDVNQDGANDLVVRNSTSGLGWSRSEYPFGMNPVLAFPDPTVTGFLDFARADLNGDGLDDLVGSNRVTGTSPGIEVFLAQPGGTFLPPEVVIVGRNTQLPLIVSPHFADLDGDGDLDVVATDNSPSSILVGENASVTEAGGVDPGCTTGSFNSRGLRGEIVGSGSSAVASTNLRLTAVRLPKFMFGFFVGSQTPQAPVAIPGSAGTICLGGSIGRYDAPSQVMSSGPTGSFSIALDPMALETGPGQVAAIAGQAWYFQAWHRDISPQGATSNLTNSRRIVFFP